MEKVVFLVIIGIAILGLIGFSQDASAVIYDIKIDKGGTYCPADTWCIVGHPYVSSGIIPGDIVQWRSNTYDELYLRADSSDGNPIDGTITSGPGYRLQFDQTGTWYYTVDGHPELSGFVKVVPPDQFESSKQVTVVSKCDDPRVGTGLFYTNFLQFNKQSNAPSDSPNISGKVIDCNIDEVTIEVTDSCGNTVVTKTSTVPTNSGDYPDSFWIQVPASSWYYSGTYSATASSNGKQVSSTSMSFNGPGPQISSSSDPKCSEQSSSIQSTSIVERDYKVNIKGTGRNGGANLDVSGVMTFSNNNGAIHGNGVATVNMEFFSSSDCPNARGTGTMESSFDVTAFSSSSSASLFLSGANPSSKTITVYCDSQFGTIKFQSPEPNPLNFAGNNGINTNLKNGATSFGSSSIKNGIGTMDWTFTVAKAPSTTSKTPTPTPTKTPTAIPPQTKTPTPSDWSFFTFEKEFSHCVVMDGPRQIMCLEGYLGKNNGESDWLLWPDLAVANMVTENWQKAMYWEKKSLEFIPDSIKTTNGKYILTTLCDEGGITEACSLLGKTLRISDAEKCSALIKHGTLSEAKSCTSDSNLSENERNELTLELFDFTMSNRLYVCDGQNESFCDISNGGEDFVQDLRQGIILSTENTSTDTGIIHTRNGVILSPTPRGQILFPGDTIEVTSGTLKIQYEGTQIDAYQNSKIKLSVEGSDKTIVDVMMGQIKLKFKKLQSQLEHKYQVLTPASSASIRGTEFITNYDPDSKTSIFYLYEGNIGITPIGTSVTTEFSKGTTITVKNGVITSTVLTPADWDTLTKKLIMKKQSTKEKVPEWIKNNVRWWAEGAIDDNSFKQGIQHMIKENIISIKDLPKTSGTSENKIPDWVKNNAKWWADGVISEDDFVNGLKYMVEKGIIQVN